MAKTIRDVDVNYHLVSNGTWPASHKSVAEIYHSVVVMKCQLF